MENEREWILNFCQPCDRLTEADFLAFQADMAAGARPAFIPAASLPPVSQSMQLPASSSSADSEKAGGQGAVDGVSGKSGSSCLKRSALPGTDLDGSHSSKTGKRPRRCQTCGSQEPCACALALTGLPAT